MDTDWTRTEVELPPERVEVQVLNGEHVTTLVRDGNLWWFPDRTMYVYYVPKFWKHIPASTEELIREAEGR